MEATENATEPSAPQADKPSAKAAKPVAKKAKYPPGATLRCPCGIEGKVAAVSGHRARSKDPRCHSVDRLYVVGADEIPPPLSTLPPPPLAIPLDGVVAEPDAAFEGYAPIDDFGAFGDIDPDVGDEPPTLQQTQPVVSRPVVSNGNGNGKAKTPRRGNNGNGSMEWRQPAAGQAATALYPEPGMIRSVVELPVRTHAYYEAARNDPDLAFEGTLSEFVDMCVDQFFHAIGYVGVRLVKAMPSHLEVG